MKSIKLNNYGLEITETTDQATGKILFTVSTTKTSKIKAIAFIQRMFNLHLEECQTFNSMKEADDYIVRLALAKEMGIDNFFYVKQ